MIDPKQLLGDTQSEARRILDSLRERLVERPELRERLKAEHAQARDAGRTGSDFPGWLRERLEQVAANWVLACVFVRFLEDNDLVETPRLSGVGDRLARARDEETLYFRRHPDHSARELLEDVFRETSRLPGMADLLGEGKNPLWALGPTGDGARALLELWRKRSGGQAGLVHDFSDPDLGTRFLGDLYQDLSEFEREHYALLQTPPSVESFILDETLSRAFEEFPLPDLRVIDPACGSGHFLLGAFRRLLGAWQRREPATPPAALVKKALGGVTGVDVNPFAIAIARFRLVVAALAACGAARLRDLPALALNLAAGDALLHGPRPDDAGARNRFLEGMDPLAHVYEVEDANRLRQLLGKRYHVVVANPPYVAPNDPALNTAYRERFSTCYGQYVLSVPFLERCLDLAVVADPGTQRPAGFVGTITANSFMTREFGVKLVQEWFPKWDLYRVIDSSGFSEESLPGHLTPTVMLFLRAQRPVEPTVRTVRGKRREATPGQLWQSLDQFLGRPGSEDDLIVVQDVDRSEFHRHPWKLRGGGASELAKRLSEAAPGVLKDESVAIGRMTHTGKDPAFCLLPDSPLAVAPGDETVPFVVGGGVRDFVATPTQRVFFPYEGGAVKELQQLSSHAQRHCWRLRTVLRTRRDYGETPEERGLAWYEHSMFFPDRFKRANTLTYAEITTHNHFAVAPEGALCNRTSPSVLFSETEADRFYLWYGVLNSSIAALVLKQTCSYRGKPSKNVQSQEWARRFQFASKKLGRIPRPTGPVGVVIELARSLASESARFAKLCPGPVLASVDLMDLASTQSALTVARSKAERSRAIMVGLQEELDWACYQAYGLLEEAGGAPLGPGEVGAVSPTARPFEVVLGRKVLAGEEPDFWFSSLGRKPEAEIPGDLTPRQGELYEVRLRAIEVAPDLITLEQPQFKRKWEPFDYRESTLVELRRLLVKCLAGSSIWTDSDPVALSCAQIAEVVVADPVFQVLGELYRGRKGYDACALVEELVLATSVPAQRACRYSKPNGLAKRLQWEALWQAQREEDAVRASAASPAEAEAAINSEIRPRLVVPADFGPGDFTSKTRIWPLRGKLDVPQESFVEVHGATREGDPTPVVFSARYDLLQRAQAIAGLYVQRKEEAGWGAERIAGVLVALHELLPWLRQWHNEYVPSYGMGLGDYFSGFVEDEARFHGLTLPDLAAWAPPPTQKKKKAKKKKAKKKKAKKKSPRSASDELPPTCERCGSVNPTPVEISGEWYCTSCRPQ